MFEKEAEIYALSNYGFRGKYSQRVFTAKIDYQKGAEFVYNKMNQWHSVENDDLPKKRTPVLAYCKKDASLVECVYIPDVGFKHPIFSNWYEPTAWIEKEIVLPDEAGK